MQRAGIRGVVTATYRRILDAVACRCSPRHTSLSHTKECVPYCAMESFPSKVRCRGVRSYVRTVHNVYTYVSMVTVNEQREWVTFPAFCLCSKIDTCPIKTRYVNELDLPMATTHEDDFIPEKCICALHSII